MHDRIRVAGGHQARNLRLAGTGHHQPQQLTQMHVRNAAGQHEPRRLESPADLRNREGDDDESCQKHRG